MKNIEFKQSPKLTLGAAAGDPIVVPGIRPGDVLLAVMEYNAATQAKIAGLDVSAFTVEANAIRSSLIDTTGWFVHVVFADGRNAVPPDRGVH